MIAGILLQLLTLLVAVLKGVVSLTLLSRQGPAFYATLSQFLVLATFCGSVLSLQLDAATVRFAADGRRSLGSLLSANLLCVAAVGLLLMVAMALGGDVVSPWVFDRAGWRLPMVLAAASATLTALLLVCYSSLQAQSQFRRLAGFQMTQYLLQIVAIAWSVHYGHESVVMACLLLADGLTLLVVLAVLLRRHGLCAPDRDYLRLALPFALPLLASFFLTWLIHASGRFVLVNVHGLAAVAPYAATFTIAALSGLLTPPFVNVLYPQIMRLQEDGDAAARLLGRALAVYLLLSLPMVLAMIVLGQPLVELASGPGFYAGALVMGGLACGILFTGMSRLAGLILLSSDRTRLMMFYLAAGAVLNMLVLLLGVPRFGANALAGGYAAGFLLPLLLLLARLGPAALGVSVRGCLLGLLRISAALSVMALIMYRLPAQGFSGIILCGSAGMAGYAVMAVVTGLLRREDLLRGRQLLLRKLGRSA